jgi:hypothetical protein
MSSQLLGEMQQLLASINDVAVTHDVNDFLITRPQQWLHVSQSFSTDEQVLIAETEQGAEVGVFIDAPVLQRLARCNPLQCLSDANLADYCTVLEGISHFQYLIWCMEHARPVSLLELELQAEVDKYAFAMWLLMQQTQGRFPDGLHLRMFTYIGFANDLDRESRQRYEEANRHAARFCRQMDERFLRCRRRRIAAWIGELRRFYRCDHHAKLRHSWH